MFRESINARMPIHNRTHCFFTSELAFTMLKRQRRRNTDEQEIHRLETSLNGLIEREGCLMHLHKMGKFEDEMLQTEQSQIAAGITGLDTSLVAPLRYWSFPHSQAP